MEDPIDMPHKLGEYLMDHINKSGYSVGLEAYLRCVGVWINETVGSFIPPPEGVGKAEATK